jgi:hypothetical protein
MRIALSFIFFFSVNAFASTEELFVNCSFSVEDTMEWRSVESPLRSGESCRFFWQQLIVGQTLSSEDHSLLKSAIRLGMPYWLPAELESIFPKNFFERNSRDLVHKEIRKRIKKGSPVPSPKQEKWMIDMTRDFLWRVSAIAILLTPPFSSVDRIYFQNVKLTSLPLPSNSLFLLIKSGLMFEQFVHTNRPTLPEDNIPTWQQFAKAELSQSPNLTRSETSLLTQLVKSDLQAVRDVAHIFDYPVRMLIWLPILPQILRSPISSKNKIAAEMFWDLYRHPFIHDLRRLHDRIYTLKDRLNLNEGDLTLALLAFPIGRVASVAAPLVRVGKGAQKIQTTVAFGKALSWGARGVAVAFLVSDVIDLIPRAETPKSPTSFDRDFSNYRTRFELQGRIRDNKLELIGNYFPQNQQVRFDTVSLSIKN